MIVCLWLSDWPADVEDEEALVARLAERVPRLAVAREERIVWADVRGLPGEAYARRLAGEVAAHGIGIGAVPVVARAAAWSAAPGEVRIVPAGEEAAFLAELPLEVLSPEPRTLELLRGVGVERCGQLVALGREPVEVRFGAEGVRLRRLARGDDAHRLFAPPEPDRPGGSIDFVDYVVTDPARLLFTANALLGPACEALRARGEHARRIALVLPLANGRAWRRVFRASRPTASREHWLRRIREALDRLTVPDAVTGVALRVEAVEEAEVRQGDLFDRGFATAAAVESAVGRLLESQGEVLVEAETDLHPLPERRTRWRARDAATLGAGRASGTGVNGQGKAGTSTAAHGHGTVGTHTHTHTGEEGPVLGLRLLPEPRVMRVATSPERGYAAPRRIGAGEEARRVVTAAGPDRISGGHWDAPFAREYWRCVTEDGALLWLYRDARRDAWFLHGWWD